jgi:crotonobetaine/carnitine-CoA ligase
MSAYEGEWVASAILEDRAERLGDQPFVSSSSGSLTYAQLAHEAARIAGALRERGVRPGDRVATMLPSGLEYLKVWWGIVWAGAVDVPVNNDFKGEFLDHVVGGSGAKLLILDPRWRERAERYADILADPADLVADPVPRTPRSERDLLYIMYTSGTTGRAKGVMHANRSALWNAAAWLEILGLTGADTAYSMFPLFHVTARSAVVTATMWAGGRAHLADGFSATRFWDEVRAADATWFGYMGIVIHLLHAQPPREDDRDNRVRIAFGAAAPPAIMTPFEERFGLRLVEVYGSTELGPASAPRYPHPRKPGTMGLPCRHLLVEVHDEDDRPLPPNVAGELVARPAEPFAMTQGYWNEPRATIEAFRNLWFHTGDGGYLDDEGYVVFTDRVKDSLRRRGENISSFEVERGVQRHPDVLECAAYAVPAELSEDEVMIAVVPREGHTVDPAAVMAFCIDELPRFMVPRYLRVMDALPKTPSQRIEKYRLRDDGITPDTFDREAAGLAVPRS